MFRWFFGDDIVSAYDAVDQATSLTNDAVGSIAKVYSNIDTETGDQDRRATENLIKILAGKSLVNSELVGQGAAINQKDLESANPELEALLGSPENGEVILSYPEGIFNEDVNHVILFQMYEREDESTRIGVRELETLFADKDGSGWFRGGVETTNPDSTNYLGRESDFFDLNSIGGLNRDRLTDQELSIAEERLKSIQRNSVGPDGRTVLSPSEVLQNKAGEFFDLTTQQNRTKRRISNSSYTNRFREPFQRRTLEKAPPFKSKQSIFLYMPTSINETNIQTYDTPELLLATFASKAFKDLAGKTQNINTLTTELIKQIENAGNAGTLALASLADAAVNVLGIPLNAQQALTQLRGLAINPRKEQVYKSPEPRTFNYVFELYPRSRRETEMVNSMIRLFKYHAAPDLDASGNVFVTPATFRIKYLYKNAGALTENIFLNRIKDCVLTEVNVDYTSAGKFTAFRDGAPVGMKLSLTFREIETVVKGDILEGA